MSKLRAQEFIFTESDECYSEYKGQNYYCAKEELLKKLNSAVNNQEFTQIEKTKRHSFTFLPKQTNGERRMPVRVYLSDEDLKRNNPKENYEECFEVLRCNVEAQKIAKVKKFAMKTGAVAFVAATTISLVVGLGMAYEKEAKYNDAKVKDYYNQFQTQQDYEKAMEEKAIQDKIQADKEREMVGQATTEKTEEEKDAELKAMMGKTYQESENEQISSKAHR